MREARVIALAGVFQACAIVRNLAQRGNTDSIALESSISSIFKIDADSPAAVFDGIAGVRLGLATLTTQLDGRERDLTLTRLVVNILQLERKFARHKSMPGILRENIRDIERQVTQVGCAHPAVIARLAELYMSTISQLKPRVLVHGNPLYLDQPRYAEQIRAALLAAIRAAVLWRQLGGNQWQLLLRRREYAMLARGLLARCTLDNG